MPAARRGAVAGLCLLALVTSWGTLRPATASHGSPTALVAVDDASAPAFLDDSDVDSLRRAVQQSLVWLARQHPEQALVFGPRAVKAGEYVRGLRRVLEILADDPSPETLEDRLLAEFDVLRSVGGGDGTVLATGYYEPIVRASETPTAEYRVPIYGVPRDLPAAPKAYWTRGDIEQGRLGDLARPIAWARDPVDVFFMEIEGSGTLRLAEGRDLRVGYAGTNGRPYRSIARLLIDEGHIEREAMSMRALREWLTANPDQLTRVLNHNPSYVFFGRRAGPPVGSLAVPLTPGRSIATDATIFPPGSLSFLLTQRPRQTAAGGVEWSPVSRFVLSQDVGGAIRGPGRVDVFWGRGPDADLAASEMQEPGELYVLVPKRGAFSTSSSSASRPSVGSSSR